MVEEMEEYVKKEEADCREAVCTMRANEKLLLDLQSGIATLYEKLKDVKLKPVCICYCSVQSGIATLHEKLNDVKLKPVRICYCEVQYGIPTLYEKLKDVKLKPVRICYCEVLSGIAPCTRSSKTSRSNRYVTVPAVGHRHPVRETQRRQAQAGTYLLL